ncbi:hypothetical protein E3N88_33138 [Mikania micrantha]|uniref:Uncharacterized protein n=1 Tax=Mikania micrantha TaxID=192012 RepID=A0A5N6MD30_9ASTR|nr:hypothetical protein E3N88_33138 [Mikania micrantha]
MPANVNQSGFRSQLLAKIGLGLNLASDSVESGRVPHVAHGYIGLYKDKQPSEGRSYSSEAELLPNGNLLLPKAIQDKLLRKAKHLEDLKIQSFRRIEASEE